MLGDLDRVYTRCVGQDQVTVCDLWVAQQPVGARSPLLQPAQVGGPGDQVVGKSPGGDLDLWQCCLDLGTVLGDQYLCIWGQRVDAADLVLRHVSGVVAEHNRTHWITPSLVDRTDIWLACRCAMLSGRLSRCGVWTATTALYAPRVSATSSSWSMIGMFCGHLGSHSPHCKQCSALSPSILPAQGPHVPSSLNLA